MIHSCRVLVALTVILLSGISAYGQVTLSRVVTNANDSGTGSLREAIGFANTGACGPPCTITFQAPPFNTPQTISLLSTGLVVTAQNVTIDGFSGGKTGSPNTNAFGAADNSVQNVIISGVSNTCCIVIDTFSMATNFVLKGVVLQNSQIGLNIAAPGAVITGSKFGTNNTGTAAVFTGTGIRVGAGGSATTIGGGTPADRNLISGNTSLAIDLIDGGNTVAGNYIGVNATLSALLPNQEGIRILGSNNTIGVSGTGNLIKGNTGSGIRTTAGSNNIAFNTIEANGQYGVVVDGAITGVVITRNAMQLNGQLGIDLRNASGSIGPTPNDPGDTDSGAGNNLQNFPVITSATLSGGTLTATVDVNSNSATNSLRVELFKADTDPAYPEGARFLFAQCYGGATLTSGTLTNGTLTVTGSGLTAGDRIVATATSYTFGNGDCVTVLDGTSEFSAARVVIAPNSPPVANPDSATTSEDAPVTVMVLANDTDPDGNPLTVTANTSGSQGTVTCTTAGACTYTPNANTNGSDSFTYTVSDGSLTSTGTVSVTINAVNDPPVANPDSLTTNEDTAGTVNVLSNDTDIDTPPTSLTVTGNTNGTKGTVTCTSAGACTYTPNLNANGTDSFTYTVSDGTSSSTGVVNVTITPVNDPPVANPDTASTVAGTPVTKNVTANDTDADGDPISVSSSTNGANGTVACSGSNCTYTPAGGFSGTDSFTYTITDGAGGSATTTVSVIVSSVNAAPNATDDSASTLEGLPVNINVLANDSDPNGDPLTITSFTQGTKGTVTCTTLCTYRANRGQSGADSFTYTISDGKGGTATATVRISIRACPAAAFILSPPDGATNVPTTGNLSFASGSSNNTVYFGPAGSGCSTAYFLTTRSQVGYSNLQPGADYEWRVEGQEPGCPTTTTSCVRFRTAVSCPAAPTPLQPAANASVQSPVTFAWTGVTGATNYRVFVSASGGPATEVGSTTATTLTAVVPDGAIRWFVVATVTGCGDLQSATVSFNVCNAPGQPLAGVVGESTSEQTYSVSWFDVAGATRYEVQEATNAAFTDAQTFPTPSTSLSFTKSATTARPFFYRVRAFSDCFGAFGPFSPVIRVVIVPVPPREDPDTDATVPVGSRKTVVLQVFVAGEPNQTLRYSATVDKPWMRVDPASGPLPPEGITLNVTVNPADQPNGTITGTVIVTISDTSGARQATHATTTKQVPVSINLVTPVLPIGSGTPPDTSMIIPVVGHLDGVDARWRSDVRIANTSGEKLRYQVSLVPADVNIGQKQTTIDIEAGATTALDDVVRAWYGVGSLGESSAGYLEIRPLSSQRNIGSPSVQADPPGISLATVVTSRTYSQTSAGTLGEFIPGIPFGNFIGRSAGNASQQVLNLQQIAQDANFRTNVGLVEASGNAASALVSIFNATGTKLRDVPVALRANEQRQLNSLLAQQNITLADGRIEVRVTGGEGKVTAYAAVVDNRSKDQLFVPPVALTNLLFSKYVVAGVADLISGNAVWRSDLRIFNAGSTAQNATLTLYPQNNSGSPVTANISINSGAVSILDNIVQDLFRTSNLGGAVHVDTPSGSSLVVTGRTYIPTANGNLGQFIEAVTPDEAVGSGERALNILQAEDSVRYRTNLGLAEVTGKAAVVEVTISLPDSKVSPVVQIPLAANQFTQLGILRGLGIGNIYNARLSIRVISGEGRVTAYGSLIDMKTQDSTYIPAR